MIPLMSVTLIQVITIQPSSLRPKHRSKLYFLDFFRHEMAEMSRK